MRIKAIAASNKTNIEITTGLPASETAGRGKAEE
jgi:hypothetical protein